MGKKPVGREAEIVDLLKRLRKIEKEMPDKKGKSETGKDSKLDRFMEIKSQITGKIQNIKSLIKELHDLQSASRTRGGTSAVPSAPERAASPSAAPPLGGPWAGSAGALPTCAPSSHTCSPAPRR